MSCRDALLGVWDVFDSTGPDGVVVQKKVSMERGRRESVTAG